jgi:RimJ/RimL family protein N-acetyltransferase
MRLMLHYAFTELNLQRITLAVFDYNRRAVRSYEKAGFTYEGRERGFLYRDGERADTLFMGILRDEWLKAKSLTGSGSSG